MPLTDRQVRRARAAVKCYKLTDSGGLFLFVTTKGVKSWRLRYHFRGKEKGLTFGHYPTVSLADARRERDAARQLLRDCRDPIVEGRRLKLARQAAAEVTFRTVGQDWHEAQRVRWSPRQAITVRQALERDVYPALGDLPIAEIDAPTVLKMLRDVERRGAIETAKRIRHQVSAIFGYGIAEGRCAADPAAVVARALKPSPRKQRQPAVRGLAQARELLTALEASTSGPLTKLASRLLALTAVRPGVLRTATWAEFEGIDWSNPAAPSPGAIWRIPSERMKLELEQKEDEAFEHVVPLVAQSVDVLRATHQLTGSIAFLFPSVRSTRMPMSENTLSYMYARNGCSGRHVPHGWRSSFSTIMNERAATELRAGDRAIIDAMLAHRPRGLSGSEMAYNRAIHMARRREIAETWADLLTCGLAPAAKLLRAKVTG